MNAQKMTTVCSSEAWVEQLWQRAASVDLCETLEERIQPPRRRMGLIPLICMAHLAVLVMIVAGKSSPALAMSHGFFHRHVPMLYTLR